MDSVDGFFKEAVETHRHIVSCFVFVFVVVVVVVVVAVGGGGGGGGVPAV